MHSSNVNTFKPAWPMAALIACAITLSACSSPAEKADSYYQKGIELMKKGDFVKANIELQNALQIKQDMVPAWYALAQIAEQQNDWKRMFGLLNKVVDQDPKHLDAQVKLARLLLAAGQMDRALAASDVTMTLDKDSPTVMALRAGVLYKLNDKKGAVTFAEAALAKDANNVDALVVLATERLAAKDAAKAIEYLDRGLKSNEKNIALQLIKVQAYETLAKLDDAEAVFRRLIALYPENRTLHHVLAQFFLSHGRKDAAEAEYRALVNGNPKDNEAKLDLVRFLQANKGIAVARQELEGQVKADPANTELKFALGGLYLGQRDAKSAEALYKGIVDEKINPADTNKARGLLAAMRLGKGDKPGAAALVEEVLKEDQRNEQGLLLKARMEIDERKLDDAIANLRNILRDTPNSYRALLMLAEAHEASGSVELAQEHYQKSFQAAKSSPQVGVPYALFLLRRNQAARAEDVVMDMQRAGSSDIAILKLLAQARIMKGDWVGAQAVSDELAKQANAGPVADQVRGAIMAARKNYDESIAAFKRVYASSPTEKQPLLALIRTYLAAGKPGDAIIFLKSVLKASPDNADALLLLAQLHSGKGEKAEAEAAFSQLLEKHPQLPEAYVGMTSLLIRDRKFDEADALLAKGLVAIPGDLGLRMTRAALFELAGRFDDAIKLYEALIKEKPGSDVLANNLASLLTDHRTDKASLERARQLAQRFNRSDVPHFKDTLGWATLKSGSTEEAVLLLESAAKQLPDDAVFRYHLGMGYLAQNKKDAARQELEKALSLGNGKDFADAERVKQALESIK